MQYRHLQSAGKISGWEAPDSCRHFYPEPLQSHQSVFPVAPSSAVFAALNELSSVWISEVCPFGKLDKGLPSVYSKEFGVGLQAKRQFLDSQETDAYMSHNIISSLQLRSFTYLFYRKWVYMCIHSLSLSLV